MKSIVSLLLGGFPALAWLSASAEDLPLVRSKTDATDNYGETSFFRGESWENGLPPGDGTNYVWAGRTLRTPDAAQYKGVSSFAFPGCQLEITSGTVAHKTVGSDKALTWRNLIWNSDKATYAQSAGANSLARVQGRVTVVSNMRIACEAGKSSDACHYDFSLENVFCGGAGRTVTVTHSSLPQIEASPCFVRISGDNADYEGRWKVLNVDAAHRGMVLCVEHDNALGGSPDELDVSALTLERDGGLSVAPEQAQPFAPQNRGLTLVGDATCGGILTTVSNETWSLGMPIFGSGRLTKMGLGTIRLCGTNKAARRVAVQEGTLALATGFASEGTLDVTVASGATFSVEPLTLDGLSVSHVAFPAGTRFDLPVGDDGLSVGVVSLDEFCTMAEGAVRIRFTGRDFAVVSEERQIAVLAIPISVRAIAAEDIVEVVEAEEDVSHGFTVETRDGVQYVSVVLRPVVYTQPAATSDGSRWWFTTVKANVAGGETYLWSDEQACHGGADYVCTNQITFRTGVKQEDASVVFPGASLTMVRGNLALKQSDVCFTNLTLKGTSCVIASGSGAKDRRQRLGGRLTVGGSRAKPSAFYGQAAQSCFLYADLRGEGVACFAIASSARAANAVGVFAELTGDNSRFTGSFVIDENASADLPRNEQTNMTLRVAEAKSLGGAPLDFLYDALRMRPYAGLQPLAEMTLATPNRGIYLEGGPCRFVVDEGCDLTVMETISYAGMLRKEGAGTLALGGAHQICREGVVVDPDGANNRLYVREGWLKPSGTNAFVNLKLTFGAAGGLRLDADPSDPAVKAYGLLNAATDSFGLEGDVLPVRVDLAREVEKSLAVVLCTVRPSVAEALRGKLRVAKPGKGLRLIQVIEDEVVLDGETYVRLTAEFARLGGLLVIR